MKDLLDENIPAPVTSTVKMLLRRSHDVQHVIDMPGWSGTKDLHLYGKAKDAGFQVVVTNDAKQMNRKLEVEAIARSGLHRVQYPHKQDGLPGLGLAMATVCAALPSLLQELAASDGQRLVLQQRSVAGVACCRDPSPGLTGSAGILTSPGGRRGGPSATFHLCRTPIRGQSGCRNGHLG